MPALPQASTRRPASMVAGATAVAVAAAVGVLGACAPGEPSPGPSTSASSTSASASSPSRPASASTSPTTARSCVDVVFARMTPAQRVGQLFMVGLQSGAGRSSLDGRITSLHLGGVLYLGGWSGASWIRATSARLQRLASRRATAGVRLFIAADQEGGQVQELDGPGFSDIPSALSQGLLAPATLQTKAAGWGRELARVGVNVSLAPVGDTVPAELGRDNGPIGRYDREFGHEPARVGASVVAVVKGMTTARIQSTVKHFPGLGRIRENTDFSSTGITDRVTTTSDAYLGPFADGIDAGTGLIMISSAWYPRIDARNQAVFSRAVITTLLRGRLGYGGVVISDDVGAARAVASVSPGNRAVRFIAAGGDIVLTADPRRAGTMVSAVTMRMARDRAFAGTVETAVRRVLALKATMGLVDCTG